MWGFKVAAKLERGYFENHLVLGISMHSQEANRRKHMCTASVRAVLCGLSWVSLEAHVYRQLARNQQKLAVASVV